MDESPSLIKKVSSALEESLLVPMWGQLPPFPWDAFSLALQDTFKVQQVELTPHSADWKAETDLLEGLGEHPTILSTVLSPLAPAVFCAFSTSDLDTITHHLLDKEGKRSFSDKEFQKGFFRFTFLRCLKEFDQLKIYPGLSPKLTDHPFTPAPSYCIDFSMHMNNVQLTGRLICPTDFHRVFTSHISSRPFSLSDVDSSLELPLSLQIGRVDLTPEEWSTVELGDLLILDQCSYHPVTHQGSLTIVLGDTTLLIAKRKHQEIKILDYATYEPIGETIMDDEDNQYNEEFDEEEMFEDEKESEDEEEYDEEQHDEEESASDALMPEELLDAKDVPLSLRVEVAQIKMPLKELLLLKPGNTLQLPVSAEQGVTITLNSKPIARGELLQIGDLLGVKISAITH